LATIVATLAGAGLRAFVWLRSRLARARADRRGSVIVEFAVVVPVFLAFACMVVEDGLLLYAQAVLDNATRDASRLIQQGRAADAASFYEKLCADVSGVIPCADLQYRVQASETRFSSLSAAVTTDGNGDMENQAYTAGGAGQYMLVQVGYKRSLFIPWIGSIGSPLGRMLVVSTCSFQNEPYR